MNSGMEPRIVSTIAELEKLYGVPGETSTASRSKAPSFRG